MNRALKIILAIEIAVGVLWTVLAAMAQGAGGLAIFGLFLLVYALYAAFFLFAVWVLWKHPDKRRIAGWILVLPILFWFLPLLIRSMSGGVLTTETLVIACLCLLTGAMAFCWIAPRRAAVVFPEFLVRSRLFNWLVLLALFGGWLFLVLVVAYVAGADTPRSTSGTGEGLGLAIVMAAIYLIWLGAGSFGASTWAWVSIRGGIEGSTRKLNIAQLVVAAPGIFIGVSVTVWLVGQGRL